MNFFIIKALLISFISFIIAFISTPLLIKFLYKYKLGKSIRNGGLTPIFSKLHAHKAGTPTMGGILIWGTVFIVATVLYYLSQLFPDSIFQELNFLSRTETLLPLGTLVAAALVGLVDDWIDITRSQKGGGGFLIRYRLLIYAAIALIGAWWFYYKLDWDLFHVPFVGMFNIGFWYIPVFVFIIVATSFSVNETDGLDGLAGGTLLMSFASYGVISFSMGKYDLAVFCAAITGALLTFLWYNIAPAKFIMGDTGAMSLGVTLGVIAMLTNTALILPIIGIIFVMESLSVIIQLTSKRLRNGKKVFISTPIHHHFEAIGWPETKIVMRFWVISGMTAAIGLMLFFLDKTI